MATETGDEARFEDIEWDEDPPRFRLTRRAKVLTGALVAIVALFAYDYHLVEPGRPTLFGWYASRLDWLYLVSLVVLALYVVVPAARSPNFDRYWARFRRAPLAVPALAYLVVYALFATVGTYVMGDPIIDPGLKYQPPVFGTVEYGPVMWNCVGTVTGDPATGQTCAGTWQHPLGTDNLGRDMVWVLAQGARVSLLVALVASMLIVPIAITVGTVAGYLGGGVDDARMGYVDVQQTVPALVVYVVLVFVFVRSLFLIILVFGLFSWGDVARLVRSEVVQRREATYVVAAREAGASHLSIIRRHLLPNVSTTVVTSTFRKAPMLILTEAALAYLLLSDADLFSWGVVIKDGLRVGHSFQTWWTWVLPGLMLTVTAFAFSVVGDALREALDPRGDR
jgi:peptide/nickel transport system permease protein